MIQAVVYGKYILNIFSSLLIRHVWLFSLVMEYADNGDVF